MTNKLTLIITLSITFSTIYSVENSYIDQQEIYSQEIEAEIEAQNQSTVLTLETELYGTPLKDAESLHLNWYKEGTRTGKIQNTAVITKTTWAWHVQVMQDTMENYPTTYDPKLHESLLHHIKEGSALLCNNVPRSSYLKNWGSSYAIILNSKKPSDCDKIREFMKKEDRIKKYFDAYNAKKAAQK